MLWLLSLPLLLVPAADPPMNPDQSFRLESGDFRWVPFTVRQPPTGVHCIFEVLQGKATVHAELLPMSEFRLFDRGRDHDTLAVTPDARRSEFRRIVNTPGQYAIVVVNARHAAPVVVSLHVETELNPNGSDVASTLPPGRRLTVVLISLGFFFVTAAWSSRKLIVAMRSR